MSICSDTIIFVQDKMKIVLDKIIFVQDKKFCPKLKSHFSYNSSLMMNFLSMCKIFCSGQKILCLRQFWFCPGQKSFCLDRWIGHSVLWHSALGTSWDYPSFRRYTLAEWYPLWYYGILILSEARKNFSAHFHGNLMQFFCSHDSEFWEHYG